MPTKKTGVSFEENIKELDGIVRKLESGEISLDEMMDLFEEGIRRTKECTSQLKNAEHRITVLMKNSSGEVSEEPFEVE